MTMGIRTLSHTELEDDVEAFATLLQDAVDHGASLGFLAPLQRDTARRYWRSLRDEIAAGKRVLLAGYAGGRLVATGQLALAQWPNAAHRAEVQKVMVDSQMRGLGIGALLMAELHATALRHDRSLIMLATRRGDRPEAFYQRLGYRVAGVIPRSTAGAAGERHDMSFLYLDLAAPADKDEHEAADMEVQ